MNIVTTQANLASVPLKDKQVIYVVDAGTLYADFYNGTEVERKLYGSDITDLTERVESLETAAGRLAAI